MPGAACYTQETQQLVVLSRYLHQLRHLSHKLGLSECLEGVGPYTLVPDEGTCDGETPRILLRRGYSAHRAGQLVFSMSGCVPADVTRLELECLKNYVLLEWEYCRQQWDAGR